MAEVRHWHLLGFVVLCIWLTQAVYGNIACANGWIPHDDECYLFNRTRLNWFRAKQSCMELGGRLVFDDDANKRTFLRTYIMDFHHDTDPLTIGYWTAANDIIQEGHWVWDYPEGTIITFTDWAPGEPNNKYFAGSGYEHCGTISGHYNKLYHWNDQTCETLDYFICETMTGQERDAFRS